LVPQYCRTRTQRPERRGERVLERQEVRRLLAHRVDVHRKHAAGLEATPAEREELERAEVERDVELVRERVDDEHVVALPLRQRGEHLAPVRREDAETLVVRQVEELVPELDHGGVELRSVHADPVDVAPEVPPLGDVHAAGEPDESRPEPRPRLEVQQERQQRVVVVVPRVREDAPLHPQRVVGVDALVDREDAVDVAGGEPVVAHGEVLVGRLELGQDLRAPALRQGRRSPIRRDAAHRGGGRGRPDGQQQGRRGQPLAAPPERRETDGRGHEQDGGADEDRAPRAHVRHQHQRREVRAQDGAHRGRGEHAPRRPAHASARQEADRQGRDRAQQQDRRREEDQGDGQRSPQEDRHHPFEVEIGEEQPRDRRDEERGSHEQEAAGPEEAVQQRR
jgi:hypothetical protein